MKRSLNGRTYVITGAASGLGLELTERFSRLGAGLILIDKNVYSKNKILKKIKGNKILIKSSENAKNYHNISKVIKRIIETSL